MLYGKPVGWQKEQVRHSLAARGVKTGRKQAAKSSPYFGIANVIWKTAEISPKSVTMPYESGKSVLRKDGGERVEAAGYVAGEEVMPGESRSGYYVSKHSYRCKCMYCAGKYGHGPYCACTRCKSMQWELRVGQKEEMEHTKVPAEARTIAKVHLREDPRYYEKLQVAMFKPKARLGTPKSDREVTGVVARSMQLTVDELRASAKKQYPNMPAVQREALVRGAVQRTGVAAVRRVK